jgi:hypothetical protein
MSQCVIDDFTQRLQELAITKKGNLLQSLFKKWTVYVSYLISMILLCAIVSVYIIYSMK